MKNFLKKYQANSLIVLVPKVTILAFLSVGFLTNCSSKKEIPTKVEQSATQWDYKTIREKREAEKSQQAENSSAETETENPVLSCRKVSESEMKRSRLSGCKPLDPREGHGTNMFCCNP